MALLTSCKFFSSAHSARKLLLLQVDPLYAGVFISSMAFPALASIFKEKIFAGGAYMISALRAGFERSSSSSAGVQTSCWPACTVNWFLLELTWVRLQMGIAAEAPVTIPKRFRSKCRFPGHKHCWNTQSTMHSV